jgi:phosphatidylglycerol:prolipoprotein diacylglycerol transferase
MLPTYKLFGHLVISFYGLFIAIGIFSALLLFYLTAKYRSLESKKLINFGLYLVIIGFIGSRVFYVIFHSSEFSHQSLFNALAFWRGGLMFQGGFLLAVLCSPILLARFHLPFWATADVIAPSLALGQGIGRIGCFFAGCCYGAETSSSNPLAIRFPEHSLGPTGVYLWPSQLFESFGLILLFIFLFLSLKRYKSSGYYSLTSIIYLCGAGILRFITDFFRDDNRGSEILGLPPTSIIALSIFILGAILAYCFVNKTNNSKLLYD